MNNDPMKEFIQNLLKEKGIEGLEKEIMEQLEKDLLSRLEDRINAMIISELGGDKLEDLNTLLDADDEKALSSFYENNIENLEEKIAAEMLAFHSSYIKS